MKKIVSLGLVLIFIFTFCSCGSSEKKPSSSSNDASGKGTKNNPYQIGETITFDAYDFFNTSLYSSDPAGIYSVSLSVPSLSQEEHNKAEETKQAYYYASETTSIALKCSFTAKDTSYNEEVKVGSSSDCVVRVSVVKEDGSKPELLWNEKSTLFTSEIEVYVDFNNLVYGVYKDTSSDKKYISIQYDDSEKQQQTIWIDITNF